mgnify:CR=1 FL=1
MDHTFKALQLRIQRSLILLFLLLLGPLTGNALPLKSTILDPNSQPVGLAHVYIDYVELLNLDGTLKGWVSFAKTQSGFELFVVRDDENNSWVGRASDRRLYDREGKLLAFYEWTTFWSYVYALDGTRLGQIKCLAFRGVCAAGAASFLSGLLEN